MTICSITFNIVLSFYNFCNYRHQCFCGNNALHPEDKLPESECDSVCKGNKKFICGGFWKNSIYNTSHIGKPEFKLIILGVFTPYK